MLIRYIVSSFTSQSGLNSLIYDHVVVQHLETIWANPSNMNSHVHRHYLGFSIVLKGSE